MEHSKKNEEGQGLVEYALILVLVAVVVIAVLTLLGPRIVVTYARVMGGFTGQSVTMTGSEVIVVGAGINMQEVGSGLCNLTVSGSALIGLQDGNILKDQTITAKVYVNGIDTGIELQAVADGGGLADLGGTSATANGVGCGRVTFAP